MVTRTVPPALYLLERSLYPDCLIVKKASFMNRSFTHLFVGSIVVLLSSSGHSQDRIRQELIGRYPYVIHASWVSDETVLSKQCDIALVGKDVQDFEDNLKRLLRPECLPSRDDLKTVIAITDYMSESKQLPSLIVSNDYLMLRYETKSHMPVMIQDGFFLYATGEYQGATATTNVEPTNAVVVMARRMLNFPAAVTNEIPLTLSRISAIGQSTVGHLSWGQKGSSPEDWYSSIDWWSDGKRVLFVVPKWTKDDYETWSRMIWTGTKRKFGYRAKQDARQKDNGLDALSKQRQCLLNLKAIEAYKETWQLEKRKTNGTPVISSVIDAYDTLQLPPICPQGGSYLYNPLGIDPLCTFSMTNSDGTIIRHSLDAERKRQGRQPHH